MKSDNQASPQAGYLAMKIISAEFIKSSPSLSLCPTDGKPEFAFIGRSNVGKSSLINLITGKKGLAQTSSTPGKTRLINHFLINSQWYLVDLPGYGFAKTSKDSREKFDRMIREYLSERMSLINIFLLVDARHEALNSDLEFMEWLGMAGIPFTIVFTKSDKHGKTKLQQGIARYKKRLLEDWEELPPIIITSSQTGSGREEILSKISDLLT
ncbi:MAG: ribosome biogenesis GTP-binding protein YihA/YsxC [Cyclobacteriaceae bacterium]